MEESYITNKMDQAVMQAIEEAYFALIKFLREQPDNPSKVLVQILTSLASEVRQITHREIMESIEAHKLNKLLETGE